MGHSSKTTETTTITMTLTQTKVLEQEQNHSPEPTTTKVHPVVMTIIISILNAVISVLTGEVIKALGY